ncbi:MAG: low molecular weight protein-tyrosine-phosphatase [Myxococcota bacterium]|jgi:protein-tyrosine phosphatase|nr:low molecular weight protein-tyrosine-phosphatase [Myxococcota bacterium]
MIRVCFVCLGNICRSPTAEGVMKRLVRDADLAHAIETESAGTAGYHVGETPDPRSREEAMRRGVQLESRAQQFQAHHFPRFDYVLAMDGENFADLKRLTDDAAHHARLYLLRHFEPGDSKERNVPDPYYGGDDGFAHVFEICEAACRGLLDHIVEQHALR